MDILICVFILFAKIVETALATFRMIIVASGKKAFGAILSFIISIVWIITTGMVVLDLMKHPFRAICLAVGCLIGSYLGSVIEEKMAMGNNMLMVITNDTLGGLMCDELRSYQYAVTVTKARGKDSVKNILMIMIPRKERMEVCEIIGKVDKDAVIITENAQMVSGGYI